MTQHTFKSKTSDRMHTVTIEDDGSLHCTCLGFNSPKRCWHVREVAEREHTLEGCAALDCPLCQRMFSELRAQILEQEMAE